MNWLAQNWRKASLAVLVAVGVALPAAAATYQKGGVLTPASSHVKLGDNAHLRFGDGANGWSSPTTYDVTARWDGTDLDWLPNSNNTVMKFGNGTLSFDLWFYGSSANNYVLWDASANDLIFQDSVSAIFGTGTDAELRWDGTDLDLLAAADDSVFKIGTGTNSFDVWIYGNTPTEYVLWDASADDLIFQDNVSIKLGTGSDVELRWDATDLDILAAADDSVIKLGTGTNSFDLWLYGNTATEYVLWDASADDLIFRDAVSAKFGNDGDVEMRWDGTDFDVLVATDDYAINFGNGTNSPDLKFFGNTTAAYALWDASADDFILVDSTSLMFGTGNDVEIRWDATDLDVLAAADDSIIKFGNGTNSFDLWFYGNTATEYLLWDASADSLIFQDNTKVAFGSQSDVTIAWDATDLDILVATDDYVVKLGNGTNSADLWLYGNTASDYILWDASAGALSTQGSAYFQLNDFRRSLTAVDAAAYSPTAVQSGTIFTNGGASGSITFTLPAVAAGLHYEFYAEDAQAITVAGPADTLVIFNDNAADSVILQTSGEIIGNTIRATGNAAGTKWLIEVDRASDSVSVDTTT